MRGRAIVIASNDLPDGSASVRFSHEFNKGGMSGPLAMQLMERGVDVWLSPLDQIAPTINARCTLSSRIDAICLQNLSPYGSGKQLGTAIDAIRAVPSSAKVFEYVSAKTLPIVAVDLAFAMSGRAHHLGDRKWVGIVDRDKKVAPSDVGAQLAGLDARTIEVLEATSRAWENDLRNELEVGGVVIGLDAANQPRARLALRTAWKPGEMVETEGFNPVQGWRAGMPVFTADIDVAAEPYRALQDLAERLFRRYARMDRKHPEFILEEFLYTNSHILRRDLYEELWKETCFAIRNGARKGFRTDLLLVPARTKPDPEFAIVEMKRPDIAAFKTEKGVLKFSAGLRRAVNQVRGYHERLSDPAYADVVNRAIGTAAQPRFTKMVLMGFRPKSLARSHIEGMQAEEGIADVRVMFYNELYEHAL